MTKSLSIRLSVMAVLSALAIPSVQAAGSAGDLEARLREMEAQMRAMRAELAQVQSKEADQDSRIASMPEPGASMPRGKRQNRLFFRGGYAHPNTDRSSNSGATAALGTGNELLTSSGKNSLEDAWYVGAGLDFQLTDDVWGMMSGTEVFGELMFEYKNFGQTTNTLTALAATNPDLGAGVLTTRNYVTQFTLTAAPKIQFFKGSDLRPWIIPFGLGLHVISPPSSGVTVLNPGLMVGAGADYRIWGDIYAGLDFRYHFTGDDLRTKSNNGLLNGVDTDGLTTGAYVGVGW